MVDDADSDDGTAGAGFNRSCRLHGPDFMGEESADIVIGALQKVRLLVW